MILRLLATALLLALLAACAPARDAAAPDAPPADAAAPAIVQVPDEDSPPKADVTPTPPGKTKPGAVKTPASGKVDYSCTTDAQCTVKDVGNCCGYYPACVNVDSPTFPEQVKAACAESGMAGICGFPSISSCQCVEGRCKSTTGPVHLDLNQTK